MSTKGGLQAWGDVATDAGSFHVSRDLDCSPRGEPTPRRGPASERRGSVHLTGTRRTLPVFREARYLHREPARRAKGTEKHTPGPGEYSVRPSVTCGTKFAGLQANCTRADRVAYAIACTNGSAANGVGCARRFGGHTWPSPPPAKSQRLSAAPIGAESPGPAYYLPSDFDIKQSNRKTFTPPACSNNAKGKTTKRQGARKGATYDHCGRGGVAGLSLARQTLHEMAA